MLIKYKYLDVSLGVDGAFALVHIRDVAFADEVEVVVDVVLVHIDDAFVDDASAYLK